jgi:6,7-dimethyl-8-ribityllumazine synthase
MIRAVQKVTNIEAAPPDGPVEVAIVVSRYNQWITDRLRDGALETMARLLATRGRATEIEAPGAYELPMLARAARDSGRFDAIVCLGCLIKGETEHDRHIARSVAHALHAVATNAGAGPAMPVTFGVITANDADQAEARAGGAKGNKGAEAMEAALAALGAIRALAHTPVAGGAS